MRRPDRRGFALIAILWVLLLVSALALDFQTVVQGDRRLAVSARADARGRWAARAGLARGVAALDELLASDTATVALGSTRFAVLPPLSFELEGVEGVVTVVDARSRVHLNLAGPEELTALFEGIGYSGPDAATLTDQILDWRDADGLRRLRGAERAEYAALGPRPGPGNAPFLELEELQRVSAVSPAVYQRIAPYLTVAGDGRINLNNASAAALRTLPGIDGVLAEKIVEMRERAPFQHPFDLLARLPGPLRRPLQEAFPRFTERAAFGPREVEVVVVAAPAGAPLRSELRAVATLAGGRALSVKRVEER
ncbi:MAG TPA: helix-hairpin-helix domain-containing protein [Longimicrobiaceae bacterium]|nr:helix-hairpin-helix domain-containing protein [Longimicrobiaceae bacterium]